jgi:glycosyltransferase involved in cell wall biosynthesis
MTERIFVLTSSSPDRPGGVERLVREMETKCELQGYAVQVFHAGNSLPARFRDASSKVMRRLSDTLVGYYVGRAAKNHLTGDVVAIISHGPVGWYPFSIGNVSTKRIHFYHGTYWGVADAIRPFIHRRGYQYLKWWAAMVLEKLSGRGKLLLSNSDQTSEEIRRRFHRECRTVWLPMDIKRFSPKEMAVCRRAFHLPENKPVGLFAGSLEPHKGFPIVRVLLESFPNIHWALLIRGRQPLDLVPRSNVTLLSDVNDDELPLLYSSADFCICPSRYEPFGYVVAEALACGTPVISSLTGASRLFLSEPPLDQLLVSEPDDIDGFRRAVSEVVLAPNYYRKVVLTQVRPKLEAIMSPESWWKRVAEATGL